MNFFDEGSGQESGAEPLLLFCPKNPFHLICRGLSVNETENVKGSTFFSARDITDVILRPNGINELEVKLFRVGD